MPVLPLPLHCYDEAGMIKPPQWLYWLLLLNSVDWLIFVFAVGSRQHTVALLSMFYPDRALLWYKLAATLPLIVTALLLGNRERLWKKSWCTWSAYLPLIILSGVASTGIVIAGQLASLHWQFRPLLAGQILCLVLLAVLIMRSQHFRLMLADWKPR